MRMREGERAMGTEQQPWRRRPAPEVAKKVPSQHHCRCIELGEGVCEEEEANSRQKGEIVQRLECDSDVRKKLQEIRISINAQ